MAKGDTRERDGPVLGATRKRLNRALFIAYLRFLYEENASESRTRWTMQVWIVVSGSTALIASEKPLSPSTTAIKTP